MGFRRIPQRAGILVVVVPLLVLMFDLRNKFPIQIILVDLSFVPVHHDPNRGKTANWIRGRVNGTELPTSITLLSIFLLRGVFFCKMGRRGVGRPTLATQH